jgi:beta-lactamase regulating signal transducer with metallopeptidase domain
VAPDVALAAWLLTYGVHSTVLLGAAWLVTALRPRADARAREALWRTALLGALVTASVQAWADVRPFGARIDVPTAVAALPEAPAPATVEPAPPATEPSLVPEAPAATGAEPAAPATPSAGPGWGGWVAGAWILGAVVLLLRRASAHRRLRRGLSTREEVRDGPLLDRLRRLAPGARLYLTDALDTPVARGVLRPEVCLPRRAVEELGPEHQEAMLAHEAAHLLRRDPAWLSLGGVVAAVFFFQPLNRLALRRLQETSEVLCDAWAARRSGAVALAECLTHVAAWIVRARPPVGLPAMALGGSLLRRRIERLLDPPAAPDARPRVAARLLPALALLLVAAFAPGFATAGGPAVAGAEPAVEKAPGPLGALDAELGRLDAEIGALADALERAAIPGLPAAALEGLRARRASLSERRDRLVALLEAEAAEDGR